MTAGTRAALLLTAFLLGSSLSASSGSAFGLVGNISAGLGEKWGSHLTFLNPINNRGTEPSVNVLLGHRALPILLEGYASETRADGTNDFDDPFQETRIEVGLGAAGIWRAGPIYSHVGGGIARISSRVKSLDSPERPEYSFTSTGHWIGAGTFLPLVAGFSVGAIGRYTNIHHRNDQFGGFSASALIGWGSFSSR